jgi:hypothetical protein
VQLFEDEYEDEYDITKTEEDTLLPPRRAGIFDGPGYLLGEEYAPGSFMSEVA